MKKILQLLFPQHETSSLKVTWNFVVLFIWTNSRLARQLSCTRVTGFFWAGCGGLSTYVLRCPLSQLRLILNQTLGLKPCRFGSGCCMAYTLKQAPRLLFCRGGLDAGLVNWLVSLWKVLGNSKFSNCFYLPYGLSPKLCTQHSHLHQKSPIFSCSKGRQDLLAAIWTQSSRSQDQPVLPAISRVTLQQSQVQLLSYLASSWTVWSRDTVMK